CPLGRGVDRAHHRQAAVDPAQSRRLAAELHLRHRSRHADRLGAAFLRVMLAARTERAHARASGARGAPDHDGNLLGSGRVWSTNARPNGCGWLTKGDVMRLEKLPAPQAERYATLECPDF